MYEHILKQMRDDHESGALKKLEAYMLTYSGYEADVGKAWRVVLSESGGSVGLEQASGDLLGIDSIRGGEGPRLSEKGEIARGGMGVVYEVRDELLRRDLAMKKVTNATVSGSQPGSATLGSIDQMPLLVRRLLEEAQVTAQLDHSGVVPVHDLGIDDEGRVYFTMKKVRGQTLGDVFKLVHGKEREWSMARALGAFIKVCNTVAYAHAKGVIHRDLKPANVMVGRYGEVYVMDWGLAKVRGRSDSASEQVRTKTLSGVIQTDQSKLEGDAALTLQGDVIGTLGYMPPEQALGKLEELEPRSDVYSIGAMLYELIAGHAPYREPEKKRRMHELLLASSREAPKPLLECDPDAPPELVAIIEKAMAQDVDARFQNAEELADELHAFMDGRVVRAYKSGLWIELRKWVQRNKALAAGIAAAVILVAGGILAFGIQQRNAAVAIAKERDIADQAAARERAERRVADGLRLAAQSAVMVEKDPSLALALAIEGAERASGENVNNALYGSLRAHRQWRHLIGHERYIDFGRFTDDAGSQLLTGDDGGQLVLWDLEAGKARHWFDMTGGKVMSAAISGDGGVAVTAHRDGPVRVIDLREMKVKHELAPEARPGATVAMTPGASVLFVARASGVVERYDPRTAKKQGDLTTHADGAWLSAVSAAGTHVATMGGDGLLRMFDVVSGNMLYELKAPGELQGPVRRGYTAVVFDPRASRFVVRWPDATAEIRRVSDGEVIAPLGTVGDELHQPKISADGSRVCLLLTRPNRPRALRVFDMESATPVSEIAWPSRSVMGLSPDGRLALAVRGFDVDVIDVDDGEVRFSLMGHEYRLYAATFSRDGRRIATMSADRVVRVWHGMPDWERRALVALKRSGRQIITVSHSGMRALVSRGKVGTERFELTVVDSKTGAAISTLPAPSAKPVAESFSPDDTQIRRITADGLVRAYDVATGRVVDERTIPVTSFDDYSGYARISPDGTRIAMRKRAGSIELYDLTTGKLLSTAAKDVGSSLDYQWSPDSTRIGVAHGGEGIGRVYDVMTGEPVCTLRGHSGYVMHIAWHPDGKHVGTTAVDTSARIWDAATGEQLRMARGMPMRRNFIKFSADGKLIAVRGIHVLLFHAMDGPDCKPYATFESGPDLRDLYFHPDGERFWTQDGDGGIRLWQLDGLKQARALRVRPMSPVDMQKYEIGDEDARKAYAERYEQEQEDPWSRIRVLAGHVRAGDYETSLTTLDAWKKERPDWARPWYLEAVVHGKIASADNYRPVDREAAREACLTALEEAVKRGWGTMYGMTATRSEEAFAPVRDDPRYQQVLVNLGLAQGN